MLADFFSGAGTEPGVVMVTPEGEVRVWENMSLGLGNMDRFQETFIELAEGDYVDKLWKIDVSHPSILGRREQRSNV